MFDPKIYRMFVQVRALRIEAEVYIYTELILSQWKTRDDDWVYSSLFVTHVWIAFVIDA